MVFSIKSETFPACSFGSGPFSYLSDYQTQEVMIDGWVIKQDAEGRYCLNDVWKASGEDKTDQVSSGSGVTRQRP